MTNEEKWKKWADRMVPYVWLNYLGYMFFHALLTILALINGCIGLALRWQEPHSN